MLHHIPASTSCISEKVKINIDTKYTSFVLRIITDSVTHVSENTKVAKDVSKFLHMLEAVYLLLIFNVII
jgi:hypothetical protein